MSRLRKRKLRHLPSEGTLDTSDPTSPASPQHSMSTSDQAENEDFTCASCLKLDLPKILSSLEAAEDRDYCSILSIATSRAIFGDLECPQSGCASCKWLDDSPKFYGGTQQLPCRLYSKYLSEHQTQQIQANSWFSLLSWRSSVEVRRCTESEGQHDQFSSAIANRSGILQWNVESFGVLHESSKRGTIYPVRSRPDYSTIAEWLHECRSGHTKCSSLWSESLESIRLIDAKKHCLVPYPTDSDGSCKCFALSYMWGSCKQQRISSLGPLIHELPGTIRDSMKAVRKLGGRYLWVDSICIDQGDELHKASQIKLMDAIYLGAFATIIALNGDSADAGLSRVGADVEWKPQLMLEFEEGQIMAERFPELEQQLEYSKWDKRGWTYQEGALSRRRICFTKHQVYFCCNEMQSSESMSSKPISRSLNEEEPQMGPTSPGGSSLEDPILQASANQSVSFDEKQKIYEKIVHNYTIRNLTHQTDALNAVSAVLQYFQDQLMPEGFFYGLSRRKFPRFLLWHQESYAPSWHYFSKVQRTCKRPGVNLPSWSWVSWNLVLKFNIPILIECEKRAIPSPLRIVSNEGIALYDGSNNEGLVKLDAADPFVNELQSFSPSCGDGDEVEATIAWIKLAYGKLAATATRTINTRQTSHSTCAFTLDIEGIIFHLPCHRPGVLAEMPNFDIKHDLPEHDLVFDEEWYVDGYFDNLGKVEGKTQQQEFLLVHSETDEDCNELRILFYLLLLYRENGHMVRGGVTKLMIRFGELERLWKLSNPRFARFLLK